VGAHCGPMVTRTACLYNRSRFLGGPSVSPEQPNFGYCFSRFFFSNLYFRFVNYLKAPQFVSRFDVPGRRRHDDVTRNPASATTIILSVSFGPETTHRRVPLTPLQIVEKLWRCKNGKQ